MKLKYYAIACICIVEYWSKIGQSSYILHNLLLLVTNPVTCYRIGPGVVTTNGVEGDAGQRTLAAMETIAEEMGEREGGGEISPRGDTDGEQQGAKPVTDDLGDTAGARLEDETKGD